MDIQNDTEVEVEFQVQTGPIGGGEPPEPIRLGIGQRETVDVGLRPVDVTFFSTQPQAGGRPKILDVVSSVRQHQTVFLVVKGIAVDQPG
jgi:hypothetical protein